MDNQNHPVDSDSGCLRSGSEVHEQPLLDALEFLDIHSEQSSIVLGTTAMHASIEALAFMCGLCFSTLLQNRAFDTDNSQQHQVIYAADQNLSRKRKAVCLQGKLSINSPMLV